MANMEITFPGGKKVNASFRGFEIRTDQPAGAGGDGSAPTPFDLFLASIGTCAGIFGLGFFQSRKLDHKDFRITLDFAWNEEKHLLDRVTINLHLPADFPQKYEHALKETVNLCSVKKTMAQPPEFETAVLR